jgi:NADPH-dependent ferric siderophore reductase
VQITPTISIDGKVNIQTSGDVQIRRIQVWDSAGRLVWDQAARAVWLPADKGVYFVAVETSRGRVVRKVLRQ